MTRLYWTTYARTSALSRWMPAPGPKASAISTGANSEQKELTMAATTNAPMTKTLKIDLHRAGSPSERRGTFVGPPPKMRLRPGAVISFDLKVTPNDPDATFEVTFPATPFTDDDTPTGKPVFSITNSNPHVGI